MTSTEEVLAAYQFNFSSDDKLSAVEPLLREAASNATALAALLYILNDENDSKVRLAIVGSLSAARPRAAVYALVKEMFDPDPKIRGHAANGVAGYDDVRLLSWSLSALLDAVSDPTTREPATRAVKAVTGKMPDKVNVSERERIRRGEHPQTIWPDHFAKLPPSPE